MTPELQKQIEQEAKAGQHTYPGTDYGHGFNKGYDSGYKFAGEKYGDLWQGAEQERKKFAEVVDKILHSPYPFNLAEYISWADTVRQLCREALTTSLVPGESAEGRYEKALESILNTNHDNYEKVIMKVKQIATDALNPQHNQ